jgi:hypothetical protein
VEEGVGRRENYFRLYETPSSAIPLFFFIRLLKNSMKKYLYMVLSFLRADQWWIGDKNGLGVSARDARNTGQSTNCPHIRNQNQQGTEELVFIRASHQSTKAQMTKNQHVSKIQ